MPDDPRTIVLTGASAGIGAAAAVELTRRGHSVTAVGRSATKLAAVRSRMLAVAPGGLEVPEPETADFATLAGVRALAETRLAACGRPAPPWSACRRADPQRGAQRRLSGPLSGLLGWADGM